MSRRWPLAATVAGVLAAHAWLLVQAERPDVPRRGATGHAAPLHIRQLPVAARRSAMADEAAPTAPQREMPLGLRAAPRTGPMRPDPGTPSPGRPDRRAPPIPAGTSTPAPVSGQPATSVTAEPASVPLPTSAEGAPAAPLTPEGSATDAAAPPITVPIYATRPPPSLALDYDVQRGPVSGIARLRWRLEEGRYELLLQAPPAAARLAPPQWASRGAIDAAGVAPERFTVLRRGRERQAANFQREAGRITYSGSSAQWPLVGGAQDRLSWMMQLASVLEAEPGRAGEGVTLFVAGAYGDAGLWQFVPQGRAVVQTAEGEVTGAVHLVREALRPYDTRVEVWLDPARHHLPVRLLLTQRATGESTEWRLRALQPP